MSAARGFGDGDRRMLLIHGILSNADGWWRLGPDLTAAGYAVTAPDLIGRTATRRRSTTTGSRPTATTSSPSARAGTWCSATRSAG